MGRPSRRTPPRRPGRAAAVSVVVAALVALAACSGGEPASSSPTAAPAPSSTAPGAVPGTAVPPTSDPEVPGLDWSSCGSGVECAALRVPVDHDDPVGPSIELAVARRPAGDPDRRIGSLVVNPGGPGVPAQALAFDARYYFSQELLDRFDIVGFDPRGTGESSPVDCVDDLDPVMAADPTPNSPEARLALVRANKDFVAGCLARTGDLLAHLGTPDAARDIDLLRQALGEERISYFGFSYGSELGAWYAELFGPHVRAMVLDGATDIDLDGMEVARAQAIGFEGALNAFLAWCGGEGSCGFVESDPGADLDALMARLDAEPLQAESGAGGPRPVGSGVTFLALVNGLYDPEFGWPSLAAALSDAKAGDGRGLLAMYDAYTGRDQQGSFDGTLESFWAIACRDAPAPQSYEPYRALAADLAVAAPRMAASFAALSPCTFWPRYREDRAPATLATEAPPIVVVGTTGDPATPFASSQALAERLASGVLLVYDGEGHTAYGRSTCISDAVDAYLVELEVPEDGTVCT